MNYEPVIGIEVHLQLKTATKLFCGCSTTFGAPANSHTCPVCLGLPGVLPVLNARALEWGIRVGLAFNGSIAGLMKFDRKQYFYPDLPKGYQISQFDKPLVNQGWIEIASGDSVRKIRLRRIHLEEDAGKLLHEASQTESFVDLNRAGVPLLEIVSEPDLRSPEEAHAYLTNLKAIVQYLDVSTCNMEEGSLRCDINVSLRPAGTEALGTRVEIKNLNSFKAAKQSLEFEIRRQTAQLAQGQRIVQETRLWDAKGLKTETMRSKEEAADYRYFPEPDLVPFTIDAPVIDRVRATLPELPAQRQARLMRDHQLSRYDAGVLTQERTLAELFEGAITSGAPAKPAANWIMGDLSAYLNGKGLAPEQLTIRPEWLGHLLQLIEQGTISGRMAKEVFARMLDEGKDPRAIVEAGGLKQIVDPAALDRLADEVLRDNQKAVDDYRKGKASSLTFLMGQVMKRSQGKANPQQIMDVLKRRLEQVAT